MRRLAMLATLFVALTGFASAPVIIVVPVIPPTGPDNLSRYKGDDGGRLLMSVAGGALRASTAIGLGPGDGPLSVTIWFHQADGPGVGHMSGRTSMLFHSDFQDSAEAPPLDPALVAAGYTRPERTYEGAVADDRLAPGRYEITRLQIYSQRHIQEFKDLSIPFEIAPRGTTYLGEFRAFEVLHKNIVGMRALTRWTLVVTDRSERDIEIVKAKKGWDPGAVKVQVPGAPMPSPGPDAP